MDKKIILYPDGSWDYYHGNEIPENCELGSFGDLTTEQQVLGALEHIKKELEDIL